MRDQADKASGQHNLLALQLLGHERYSGFGDTRLWENGELQPRTETEDLACFMAGQLLVSEHDDAMLGGNQVALFFNVL